MQVAACASEPPGISCFAANYCCKDETHLAELFIVDRISQESRPSDLEAVPSRGGGILCIPIPILAAREQLRLPFRPAARSAAHLVVWPMVRPADANPLDAAQELYRLAYEWAQAVLFAWAVRQRVPNCRELNTTN